MTADVGGGPDKSSLKVMGSDAVVVVGSNALVGASSKAVKDVLNQCTYDFTFFAL